MIRPNFEVGILNGSLPTGKLSRPELCRLSFPDRLPQFFQHLLIVGDVMPREQDRPQHLLGHKQVSQIRSTELLAHRTVAFGIERLWIGPVLQITAFLRS